MAEKKDSTRGQTPDSSDAARAEEMRQVFSGEHEALLLQEVSELESAGAQHAVIQKLEALPPHLLTPSLAFALARAKVRVAAPGERASLLRALELLDGCRGSFEDAYAWNYFEAFALFFLEREGEAIPFLERAHALRPDDEDAPRMIESARHELTCPIFVKPFRERVQSFWRWFCGEFAGGVPSTGAPSAEARRCARRLLEEVGARWSVHFIRPDDSEGRPVLEISPDHDSLALFPIFALIDAAPDEVRRKWDLRACRSPLSPATVSALAQRPAGLRGLLGPDDLRCAIVMDDHRFLLQFYSEALRGLKEEESDRVFAVLEELVDHLVGEAVAMRFLPRLAIRRRGPIEDGFSIFELPERLLLAQPRAAGWTARKDVEERYEYWSKPGAGERGLRSDIRRGWTRAPALVSDLNEGDPASANGLHQLGAAAGFFYFELWEGKGEAAAAELEALLVRFRSQLSEVSGEAVFVGEAFSERRAYQDVILWDPNDAFVFAEAFEKTLEKRVAVFGFRSFHPQAGILFFRTGEAAENDASGKARAEGA